MRGGRQHRIRPVGQTFLICTMKFLDACAEAAWISSHLIQRDETVVPVERRVLQALCHYSRCHLLKLHRKAQYSLLVPSRIAAGYVDQKHPPDKIEYAQVGGVTSLLANGHGLYHIAPILFGYLAAVYVGAVDRETGNNLGECTSQAVESEITSVAIRERDSAEQVSQHRQFAGQANFQDQLFAVIDEVAELRSETGKRAVHTLHRPSSGLVDEQSIHQICEFVPGSAIERPLLPKTFVSSENLLGNEIHLSIQRLQVFFQPIVQLPEILCWIVEAIRMIDAEAIDLSL